MLLNRLIPGRPNKKKQKEGDGLLDGLTVDTYVLRAKRFDKDEPWPEVEIPKPNFR
jgi:hypothetical protein